MAGVALITGVSSGIGRALALELAATGYAVGLVSRRREPLEELAQLIRARGGEALPLPCNITDRAAVQAAVERCRAQLGPVELAVANAGIGTFQKLGSQHSQTLEEVFRTNVFGLTYTFEAVLPGMLERGRGHLVGISSIAAWRGGPGAGAYSASKAAVSNLLEALRIELRPRGVTVTTVCPGFVRTPMTAQNKFTMPFLLEPEDAARRIGRAIARRQDLCIFPWQLAWIARLGNWLPHRVYEAVVARQSGVLDAR